LQRKPWSTGPNS